jgi:manganese/iron transport system permease protein
VELLARLSGFLVDPLQYPFMINGLLEGLLLGLASGLVGPFVVQRNLTFFSHALGHTIFPALVLAAVFRVDPLLAAVGGAALTVAILLGLRARPEVGEDSAVGIVFVGLFSLGVVLIGLFRVRSLDVGAAVVGNILGVDRNDLLLGGGLVVALLAIVLGLYRPLVLAAFDPLGARALGLPTRLLDLVLLAMVAGTVIVSIQVVGVILAVSALVTPAATARLWVGRLRHVMLLSALLGASAATGGLYAGYYVPIAPGAIIVLLLTAMFIVSTLLAPRGLVSRHQEARRNDRRTPLQASTAGSTLLTGLRG